MAKFLNGCIQINTSQMEIDDLKDYRNQLQKVVDQLNHEIRMREIASKKFNHQTTSTFK